MVNTENDELIVKNEDNEVKNNENDELDVDFGIIKAQVLLDFHEFKKKVESNKNTPKSEQKFFFNSPLSNKKSLQNCLNNI